MFGMAQFRQSKIMHKKHRIILYSIDAALAAALIAVFAAIPQPEPVQGLKADSTYDTAKISWEESDASSYRILRSDGDEYKYIGSTEDTSYTDTGLRTGTTYSYKVESRTGLKGASDNTEVSVTPALKTPSLSVSTKEGDIKVSFDDVDGATNYEIYRDGEKVKEQTNTEFVDEEAEPDVEHSYRVRAEIDLPDEIIEPTGRELHRAEAPSVPLEAEEKPDSAYSDFSETEDVSLVSAPEMDVRITGDDILISWEPSEAYASYRLTVKGDDGKDTVLSDGSETKYIFPKFDKDKKYTFSLTGYTDETESPENTHTYEIKEQEWTNKEAVQAAVDWAVMIANDDSFTYGTGKRAHNYGCYFCGNNLKIKGKSKVNGHSYEKTYCCNPFISAAYAHGAEDPNLLKACKSGHGLAMTVKSYTRYGNWKKVSSKPKKSELKVGDVLVKSNHVAMYIGDGEYVEASGESWSAKSISVKPLSDKRYKQFKFVMRYTGTGRGYGLAISEVEQENAREGAAE